MSRLSILGEGRSYHLIGVCDVHNKYYSTILKFEKEEIIKTIKNNNVDNILLCGERGLDQLLFTIVLDIKQEYDIKINLALPYVNVECQMDKDDKSRFRKFMSLSDNIVYVDEIPEYATEKLTGGISNNHKRYNRNIYMVDNCDIFNCVWDRGSKKDLMYTYCNRALNKNKQVIIMNPKKDDISYYNKDD